MILSHTVGAIFLFGGIQPENADTFWNVRCALSRSFAQHIQDFYTVSKESTLWISREARIDYLMILRGMAVIGVLLGHACGIGAHSVGVIVSKSTGASYVFHEPFSFGYSLIEILTPIIGRNFVILFFVLSGYLMGKVFFTGHHDALKGKYEFYKARYLRLAPLLYFNLLVCAALFSGADLNPIKALGDFLFITNFTGRGINLVTWSLSPEMQYYLVAPFIFLLFQRARFTDLIGSIALAVILFALPIFWSFAAYFDVAFAFVAGFSANLLLRLFPFQVAPSLKVWALLVWRYPFAYCVQYTVVLRSYAPRRSRDRSDCHNHGCSL